MSEEGKYDPIEHLLSASCQHLRDVDGCTACENRLYALTEYHKIEAALSASQKALKEAQDRIKQLEAQVILPSHAIWDKYDSMKSALDEANRVAKQMSECMDARDKALAAQEKKP